MEAAGIEPAKGSPGLEDVVAFQLECVDRLAEYLNENVLDEDVVGADDLLDALASLSFMLDVDPDGYAARAYAAELGLK